MNVSANHAEVSDHCMSKATTSARMRSTQHALSQSSASLWEIRHLDCDNGVGLFTSTDPGNGGSLIDESYLSRADREHRGTVGQA